MNRNLNQKSKITAFIIEDDDIYMINKVIYDLLHKKEEKITLVVPSEFKKIIIKLFKDREFPIELYEVKDEEEIFYSEVSPYYEVIYFNLIQDKAKFMNWIEDKNATIISNSEYGLDESFIKKQYFGTGNYEAINPNKNMIEYMKKWRGKRRIYNKQITEWIIDTIRIAKTEIHMGCPWLNETFDRFKNELENALKRGVKIRIYYGIGEKDDRREKTEEQILKLKMAFIGKGDFSVKKVNSHIKDCLIDYWYMNGSNNFGSNAMNYEEAPKEGALVLTVDELEFNDIIEEFNREGQ
ncbi:phospholipase D-like domain-containing protein [Tepidibacter hydrothermalis]|uniref:Phospholipase D-like domain-containing protein n=1 Tax=Tepidibacter hydrothermalis TaxID=3036126 RepID=A0ABY8EHI9_9FIRM|nr:phospholipase D-like domain-containing protein [Tepidibacter hydrothermalis]WFD11320.1 phospholipase D-like domain-containing protein [Tepidibacter hydrothermalis]